MSRCVWVPLKSSNHATTMEIDLPVLGHGLDAITLQLLLLVVHGGGRSEVQSRQEDIHLGGFAFLVTIHDPLYWIKIRSHQNLISYSSA